MSQQSADFSQIANRLVHALNPRLNLLNLIAGLVAFFVIVAPWLANAVFGQSVVTTEIYIITILGTLALLLLIGLVQIIREDEARIQTATCEKNSALQELNKLLSQNPNPRADIEQKIEVSIARHAINSRDTDALVSSLVQEVFPLLVDSATTGIRMVRVFRIDSLETLLNSDNSAHVIGERKSAIYSFSELDQVPELGLVDAIRVVNEAKASERLLHNLSIEYDQDSAFYRVLCACGLSGSSKWYVFDFFVQGTKSGLYANDRIYIQDRLHDQLQEALTLAYSTQTREDKENKLKMRLQNAQKVRLNLRMQIIDGGQTEQLGEEPEHRTLARLLNEIRQNEHRVLASREGNDRVHVVIPLWENGTIRKTAYVLLNTIQLASAESDERIVNVGETDLVAAAEGLQNLYSGLGGPRLPGRKMLIEYHKRLRELEPGLGRRTLLAIRVYDPSSDNLWGELPDDLKQRIENEMAICARSFELHMLADDSRGRFLLTGFDASPRDTLMVEHDILALQDRIGSLANGTNENTRVRIGVYRCCERTGTSLEPEEWITQAEKLLGQSVKEDRPVCLKEEIMPEPLDDVTDPLSGESDGQQAT